jgi:hypothetical protein
VRIINISTSITVTVTAIAAMMLLGMPTASSIGSTDLISSFDDDGGMQDSVRAGVVALGGDAASSTSAIAGGDLTPQSGYNLHSGDGIASGESGTPSQAVSGFGTSACAPLPPVPSGATVVSPGANLRAIVAAAKPGDVIALEDGTYTHADISFTTPGVTLRSVSGNPSAVIIDGGYSAEMIVRVLASNITIAEVTLTHAHYHLAHVTPLVENVFIDNAHFYRVRFIDGSEQFIKSNGNSKKTTWTNDGLVECSDFVMSSAGRAKVRNNCYTGGIDVHGGRGWIVRNNYFEGIWCDSGLADHAVFFWSLSRDTLVENNLIVNCARGIGFGLGGPTGGGRKYSDASPDWVELQHIGGIVRNNVIWGTIARYDTGIEMQRVIDAKVLHNTVLSRPSTATGRYSSIDYRWPNTVVEIRNNLVWRITQRNSAVGQIEGNVEGADESWVLDVDKRNFHLQATATPAIDTGIVDADSGVDMDAATHNNGAPDVGADER